MSQPRTLQVKIKGRDTVLASRCAYAETMRARMIGLLNHASLGPGEAMMITACNQVHTLFMRFSIDAVFLSADFKILAIKELPPWRVSWFVWKGKNVLELPMGTARTLGLNVGDQLEATPC